MGNKEVPLHLFEAYGVELEYMIVDSETLNVKPVTDVVMEKAAGRIVNEVEKEELVWSNELALHVIELKTNGPVNSLLSLPDSFQNDIKEINTLLSPLGARLMPGGMHPWMQPATESKLWPHGDKTIYQTYDRIFSCQGHGWSNLQSIHLNLGYAGDEEFGRIHAAVRLLLPILPALAASSPVVAGSLTGYMDNRLRFYRNNQVRVPLVTGEVIPEPVYSKKDYEEHILAPMYKEIEPLDPGGVLRHEWLNSRGAIARFERSAVEIRLLDIQECPLADIAICIVIIESLKKLVAQQWSSWENQKSMPVAQLAATFHECVRDGNEAIIADQDYLRLFNLNREKINAGEMWHYIANQALGEQTIPEDLTRALRLILDKGPLSLRIAKSLGHEPDRNQLFDVYNRLCFCLEAGELFY